MAINENADGTTYYHHSKVRAENTDAQLVFPDIFGVLALYALCFQYG